MLDKSAEKQDIIMGSMAGILRELRCSLCLETLRQPSTTRCAHSFCKDCIEKEISKNNACPSCHKPLSVQQIITDKRLEQILNAFEHVRKEFENTAEGQNLSQASALALSQEEQTEYMDIDSKHYRILKLSEQSFGEMTIPNVSFESKISANMTHLVLDAAKHNLAKFDQKYCLGVLYGCYIVNENWLKICIEEKEMVPEDRFEVQGDVDHGRTGAPNKARKNREMDRHNLFEGICVGLIDDKDEQYYRYLTVGQGKIDNESNELVICSDDIRSIDELKSLYKNKTLLSKKWIDDSIAFYEILKKDEYVL